MDFSTGPVPPPPTHRALDMGRLLRLASALQDAAEGGALTAELVEEVAADEGVPRAHVYAAAALVPDFRFESAHPVAFVVCAGNCQQWGALDRLEDLLRLRDGGCAFDVQTRSCLDGCDRPPMVLVRTPDGVAAVASATPQKIADAVAAVSEG